MVAVRLEGVSKSFGSVMAVDDVSLDIPEGELFFLLGPSGCGKTTILRTIAGFETSDRGRVLFDGRDVTLVPPYKRNTGMVFQNYALWPHMSVFENVAYGLRVRKLRPARITSRVSEALEMVKMSSQRDRFPNQLSGGQQQRVALARALVINPGCLLLDEPLSNLDAQLRLEMRAEIKRIHGETGVTTIYVTHDQKEAVSMAERMAVLKDGRVVQTGRPDEVYRRPADSFVAAFIGETNLFSGTISRVEGESVVVDCVVGTIVATPAGYADAAPSGRCVVSVRPEDIEIAPSADRTNRLRGKIVNYMFLGEVSQYVLDVAGHDVKVLVVAQSPSTGTGSALEVGFDSSAALVFPDEAGGG